MCKGSTQAPDTPSEFPNSQAEMTDSDADLPPREPPLRITFCWQIPTYMHVSLECCGRPVPGLALSKGRINAGCGWRRIYEERL